MWDHIPKKYEFMIGQPNMSHRHNTDFFYYQIDML